MSSSPIPNVESYSSFSLALASLSNEEKVFVIGGSKIFEEALPLADELYLTIVENEEEGDTFFPPYEHLVGKTFVLSHEERKDGFQFQEYKRKN